MSQLTYLMREIGAGVEIFYNTELASKLFLVEDDPKWADTDDTKARRFETARTATDAALKSGVTPAQKDLERLVKGVSRDRFKNFYHVLQNVDDVFDNKRRAEVSILDNLHTRMKGRRDL